MENKKSGVTLLELMVVLIIVSLMALFALPKFSMEMENKESKQAIQTLKTISQAIRLYRVDKGVYPASIADLESAGYVNSGEFFDPSGPDQMFYSINQIGEGIPYIISAGRRRGTSWVRTISLQSCTNNIAQDGSIVDDKDILSNSVTC